MRILYIAPFVPWPPNKGERIRAFHLLERLAAEHEVHLVCLDDGRALSVDRAAIADRCASVLVVPRTRAATRLRAAIGFLAGRSASAAALRHRGLDRLVARASRDGAFDCVLVFSAVMATYARHATGIPKVVDLVDVDSDLWRQEASHHRAPVSWIYRLEANRLTRLEATISASFDRTIVVSDAEADLFHRRVCDRPVSVVPNGVDLVRFAPQEEAGDPVDPPAIVFIGTMNYAPNVDAVLHFHREIFPIVRQRLPDLRFHVVGRDPNRSVRALARDPRVTVAGQVPDVRPWLSGAALAVAPLRFGRGIQNKVLEAMASGVPVVATSLGAQGLSDPGSAGVRVADEPAAFAQEVLDLMSDPERRRRASCEGRRYVERHHRWEDHVATLSRLLWEVVEDCAVEEARAGAEAARR